MSNVTRFGPDPLLDLEVANKRYVDNKTVSSSYVLMAFVSADTASADVFWTWTAGTISNTEINRVSPAPIDITTWKNFTGNFNSNTKSTSTDYEVRINSASGNQGFTVPATTTGVFADNVNEDSLSQDDLVGFKGEGSGTGSCKMRGYSSEFLV